MSSKEDEQLCSDSVAIAVEMLAVEDDLQLLHIQEHNNPSQDVSKNIISSDIDFVRNEDDEEHERVSVQQSTPLEKKLVSALKGSREKEGKLPNGKGLSVTWAPDVYDPLPSAAQTFIKVKKVQPKKKKNQEYKKNGKYKPKWKVDKGGSSCSKNKNKSMKPVQKQGGDDVRMWWLPLEEETYDD